MKYEVRYDPKCDKYLEKLPKNIASRIVKKMREVGENGRGIELLKDELYGYKVRVGDYRILIDIEYSPPTIIVRIIDHRGRIYERL